MSVQAVEYTPYTSVVPLIGDARPKHLTEYDFWRLQSYQIYEQIYWNVQDTFKLVARGTDSLPIYIPTGRTIIDTLNRYIGKNIGWRTELGQAGQQLEADNMLLAYNALFRRERFTAKFNAAKKFGMVRGDWLFHLLADPLKPQGTRIRIIEVDPGAYFPVTHPTDPDRIIAAHLIEIIAEGDKTFVKRQTYTRGQDPLNNDGSDTTIWSSTAIFDLEKWYALTESPITTPVPPFQLDPRITAIPIYHIRHQEQGGNPFGSSQLRGFERIMAGVNQAISDEELALALDGLGVYATDAPPPVDPESGKEINWRLGPGKVVEHADGKVFKRVNGVDSVAPYMDHLKFMIDHLRTASGANDAAIGQVDVTVAESGIALALRLGPTTTLAEQENLNTGDVLTQMFFDLRAWFAVYEALDFTNTQMLPVFDDPMPFNRDAKVNEILTIVAAGIATADWGRVELAKLGYAFPEDEGNNLVMEAQAAALAGDPFAARAALELEAGAVDEVVT